MANGRAYVFGAFYHLSAACGHLPRFVSALGKELENVPYERIPVLTAVQEKANAFENVTGKIDDKTALRLLMARDLRKAEAVLLDESLSKDIDAEFPFESNLLSTRDRGVDILRELGLEIEPPDVFVVASLPSPYDRANYSVIAADEDDRQQHGIAPGLYFLRDRLRPFHSRSLLLHELVHTALGIKSPYDFGRGLEEGIAEILGAFYLSSRILGKDLTTRLFLYNRLSYPHKQFWDLYLDYTRQAAFLYLTFGLDGLVFLLKNGRKSVKKVETQLLENRLIEIDLPKGSWDGDLNQIINYLIFGFARDLVVTPLAKYLAPYVQKNSTTVEVLTEANVELEAGRKALEELQVRIVAAIYREDFAVVSLSDTELLRAESLVRYELPE